jgi:acetyl-CoA carboxylase carboxyltransferase component
MNMKESIEKLRQYRESALQGDVEKAEKHRSKGKLLARERIQALLDPGTFVESGMFVGHDFSSDKDKTYGDGIITGWGDIDGRKVCVMAHDRTVKGGSEGPVGKSKHIEIIEKSLEMGVPFIGLNDASGARVELPQLGPPTHAFRRSSFFKRHILASGVVPQISAILGTCAGNAVYGPALTDFIIMVEGTGNMLITGPKVIKEVTGEDVTVEKLGSARVHCSISGVSDFKVKNEESCFGLIRDLLSFLPQNCREKPPIVKNDDPVDRADDSLADIVPTDNRMTYDVREVIKRVVDYGRFFEVKAGFARNIVIGFARMNGETVGISANQPLHMAGTLCIDSSDKQSRFIRFCDAFNIPIIFFVDNPGYLPGLAQEHGGIIRHGAKSLYAIAEATVPKLTVLLRKGIGGGFPGSGGSKDLGIDRVFAWPIAYRQIIGPEGAVEVIYQKEISKADNPDEFRRQKIQEIRRLMSGPYLMAAIEEIDEVIEPRETRQRLIASLEFVKNKKELRHWKKHGLMPI